MFNNPYNFYPYMNTASRMVPMAGNIAMSSRIPGAPGAISKGGIFKSLSGIKWGNVLNNTQKTLNVINQAIPVYYQIKPIWQNVKSFGKIMEVFNSPDDNNNQVNNNNISIEEKKETSSNSPTFFIN